MTERQPSQQLPRQAPRRFDSTHSAASTRTNLQRISSGNHLDDAGHYYSDDDPYRSFDRGVRRGQHQGLFNGEELTEEKTKSPDPSSHPPHPEVDLEAGASRSMIASSTSSSSSDTSHDTDEVLEIRDGIRDVRDRDMETPAQLAQRRNRRLERKEEREKDPNLVTWEGPHDPENPKNWPFRRKWMATIVVSIFTFISPVSSSLIAPSLPTIGRELHITSSIQLSLTLSIFLLAYAIGPLLLGPLSEIYGRTIVLQLSNLFFLFFNIGCALARTKAQLIVFRFLSGLGGSAPLALGGGVLSDLFVAEERGKAVSIYSLAPLLGPAIGPIAGGFITANTSWRWAFWATSIADGVIQLVGFWNLQETYAPVLLGRKKRRLVMETGNEKLHTEYERPDRTLRKTLRIAVSRPFILLGTQPIIQVLAVYMAFLYGMMYLMLSTFPRLWTQIYHQPLGTSGLNYISLGLGFFLGTQTVAPLQDIVYRRLKLRNNHIGRPEFRVPLMFPGAVLVPAGLFLYGWSANAHTHWIVPNIGACIFAAGQQIGFQCMQTYVVDAYTRYAASAVGAVTVLRSLAGFGFPLFAPYMWERLGYGWGGTLLGLLGVVLGVPGPILLWKYGERLRGMSRFAAGP